jgi:hypothetical protein
VWHKANMVTDAIFWENRCIDDWILKRSFELDQEG